MNELDAVRAKILLFPPGGPRLALTDRALAKPLRLGKARCVSCGFFDVL